MADGLGGLPAGAVASGLAVNILSRLINKSTNDTVLRDIILDGFEKTNQTIISQGIGSATTLAVAEITDNYIRTYHVGDSTILITGQRGKIKLQTVAHSPMGYAVESGLLEENEAVHHDERHIVSNVVGAADMSITVGSNIKLSKYDTLLIASDGVFDNLYVDEIVEIIRKGSLKNAAEQLVYKCNERMLDNDPDKPGHKDDLSFILFRLK